MIPAAPTRTVPRSTHYGDTVDFTAPCPGCTEPAEWVASRVGGSGGDYCRYEFPNHHCTEEPS